MEFKDNEKKEVLELLEMISSKIEETRNNIGIGCIELLHKIPECRDYSFTLSNIAKQNPEPKEGLSQKRIRNLLFPPEQE